jgi:hypothetical protein
MVWDWKDWSVCEMIWKHHNILNLEITLCKHNFCDVLYYEYWIVEWWQNQKNSQDAWLEKWHFIMSMRKK